MEYSIGNKKLGRDTAIINFASATDCESKKLGLCKLCKICYAMKAERQYPQVLPFRRRQAEAWRTESVEKIASDLGKARKVNYIRFSEAGDFISQADVEKLGKLAESMPEKTFYGYTARKDLDFKGLPDNVVVNGSGFMVHNSFTAKAEPQGPIVCRGNCRDCILCKVRTGSEIEVKNH